jgi:ATP-dependent RNA helicase RhlE
VLDEADRMLDMGFIRDIRKIIARVPAQRQTLFFSATMPAEITELARVMLRDPARVSVTPAATTVELITQQVVHVDRAGKAALLAETLRDKLVERALVFTRTKHGADKVVRQLVQKGIAAEAIHGNKSQNQRDRVMVAFREGRIRTLVATDIAARGIDVEGITHVINYDMPNIAETYVHRIGRTARAGAKGVAISFCDTDERAFLRDIEKLIRMTVPAIDQRTGRSAQLHNAPQANKNTPNGKGRRHGGSRSHGGQNHARPDRGGQRHGGQSQRPSAPNNGEIASVGFMRNHRSGAHKDTRAPR